MCHSNTKPSNDSLPNNNNNTLSSPLVPKNPTQTQTQTKNNNTKTKTKNIISEAKEISKVAIPMAITGLLLYSRSLISMLFLGRLGGLELAGGSLAIGFANITGYSLLSGLAQGLEPICGQAFGAGKLKLICLAAQKTSLLLLLSSIAIAALWINVDTVLLLFNQSPEIAAVARSYVIFSLPDLVAQSVLHPLRIYLRSQSLTLPLTFSAAIAVLLHLPINYIMVVVLDLGVPGVALASVWTSFNLVASLLVYIAYSRVYETTWPGFSRECLQDWGSLLNLAVPSCVSVCLEWWWYEIMILLCGLLSDPTSTVASMGILIQTTALVYIFPSSLGFGVSTRVSNELGANRPEKAKLAALTGILCGFGLGFTALCFAFSVRNVWAGMFTGDGKILALTAAALPIIGLCELGNCPQTAGCGVLRGSARPSLGANVNLACFYLVGMPVAVCLGFFYGFEFIGLWLGLLAAQLSCVAAMLIVLGRTDWELQARRAQELTGSDLGSNSDDDNSNNEVDYNNVAKFEERRQYYGSKDSYFDNPIIKFDLIC